jgi:hypothetical protein
MGRLNFYTGVMFAGASSGAVAGGHYGIAIFLGLMSIGWWLEGVCQAMKKSHSGDDSGVL